MWPWGILRVSGGSGSARCSWLGGWLGGWVSGWVAGWLRAREGEGVQGVGGGVKRAMSGVAIFTIVTPALLVCCRLHMTRGRQVFGSTAERGVLEWGLELG